MRIIRIYILAVPCYSVNMRGKKSEVFVEKLRASGLKATSARLLLLRFLSKQKRPISIEKMAKELESFADKATIYRNMGQLERRGFVFRINLGHGHADYELIKNDHHHISCVSCNEVEDFVGCSASSLIKNAKRQSKKFSFISRHAIELFGLCSNCAKKQMGKKRRSG